VPGGFYASCICLKRKSSTQVDELTTGIEDTQVADVEPGGSRSEKERGGEDFELEDLSQNFTSGQEKRGGSTPGKQGCSCKRGGDTSGWMVAKKAEITCENCMMREGGIFRYIQDDQSINQRWTGFGCLLRGENSKIGRLALAQAYKRAQ